MRLVDVRPKVFIAITEHARPQSLQSPMILPNPKADPLQELQRSTVQQNKTAETERRLQDAKEEIATHSQICCSHADRKQSIPKMIPWGYWVLDHTAHKIRADKQTAEKPRHYIFWKPGCKTDGVRERHRQNALEIPSSFAQLKQKMVLTVPIKVTLALQNC